MRRLTPLLASATTLVLFWAGAAAWAHGDYNGDGVVDLDDFAGFPSCLTGPGGGGLETGCDAFNFDADTDVGLADFAAFQRVFHTVVIDTVPVGNPGNAGELSGDGAGGWPDRICGAVDYVYSIGKFEVTAGQYTEFLNAVADADTYGLYNASMWSHSFGCKIERTGLSSYYEYSVAADWANRPVNLVNWGDAARFANWLHNGQPTGGQDLSTTEDGSYLLDGAKSNAQLLAIVRDPNATWVIPSEDEWYKAAYHKNDGVTGNYFYFPTSTDSVPSNYLNPPGNKANFYNFRYTIGSPYYRTVVGEFENSESPYDTFDQAGNVQEWNEAVIGSNRAVRAGSYSSVWMPLGAPNRIGFAPTYENTSIGFRVVKVP